MIIKMAGMNLKIFLSLVIVLFIYSCIREGYEITTVRYELGTLDEVDIEFYKTFVDTNDVRFVDLKWLAELDAANPLFEYSESDFGSVNVAQLIRVDSVVITLNRDRRIIYRDTLIGNDFFNDSYYERESNTFTKTFTNEDYENADPI